jgi:uncharacterized protein GlcG (DUF336 family)
MPLTLSTAQTLVEAALAEARRRAFQPLAIVVLDARGAVKAAVAEDETSLKRFEIAHGKAFGALSLGLGSRALAKRAVEQPSFIAAVTHVVGGSLVPVPGGVLLRDATGAIVGVAGASGDLSDNDEAALLAGIAATDLVPDTGA